MQQRERGDDMQERERERMTCSKESGGDDMQQRAQAGIEPSSPAKGLMLFYKRRRGSHKPTSSHRDTQTWRLLL